VCRTAKWYMSDVVDRMYKNRAVAYLKVLFAREDRNVTDMRSLNRNSNPYPLEYGADVLDSDGQSLQTYSKQNTSSTNDSTEQNPNFDKLVFFRLLYNS
jgi:hypothetical protein